MFHNHLILLILLVFGLNFNIIHSEIIINEIMSSNQGFYLDEDGEDSDWIELYNNSTEPINLNNYSLSDDENLLNKWNFPKSNLTIKPAEYLLVYCSGKDKKFYKSNLHTNFSISNDGENIILSKNQTIIHQLPAIKIPTNKSYGLVDFDLEKLEIFDKPTPKSVNKKNLQKNDIVFSHNTGIYPNSFYLKLDLKIDNPNHTIRYTTDGNRPTINSKKYENELFLDEKMYSKKNINQIQVSPDELNFNPIKEIPKCIVIKAAVFDENNNLVSNNFTNSYFIRELFDNFKKNRLIDTNNIDYLAFSKTDIFHLPIISLTSDSLNLFDYNTGIMVPGVHYSSDNMYWSGNYHKRGDDWEKDANFQFLDTNGFVFNEDINLRMHGNSTRAYIQKPFRLKSKNELFQYKFFQEKDINNFKNLVLSPFNNSWLLTGMEDYISNRMAKDFEVDYVAQRPCILFLNGEFWGYYYLQERIDEYFVESNFNIKKENVDLIETWAGIVSYGSDKEFQNLYNFVYNNDLTVNSNYEYVESKIDIDNFINYNIFEILIANADWPANNVKLWLDKSDKAKGSNGKWKWIFYDGAASLYYADFKVFENSLDTSSTKLHPTNAKTTLFFRKLMENTTFKLKFIKKLKYHLNNNFYLHKYLNLKNSISDILTPLIPLINDRYNFNQSYNHWKFTSLFIDTFLVNRKCEIANQFQNKFKDNSLDGVCFTNNVEDKLIVNKEKENLYPNPTYEILNISIENQITGNIEFKIYNHIGELCLNSSLFVNGNNIQININELRIGSYYVEIINNKKTILNEAFIKI